MTLEALEIRLSALESELAQLKQQLAVEKSVMKTHPWEKLFGSFANSEGFEEAARLGREYREAQRPQENEEAA